MRKPVFAVSNYVRHKPGCTTTEDGKRLEISDLESKGIYLVKRKALFCLAITGQISCALVFAYAKSRFSYDAAYILFRSSQDTCGLTCSIYVMFETCLN